MDRINELPDDLLVKILSFVPTKIAVSTSILSKRWRFFWMWLPKLEYRYDPTYGLEEFINKNLPLHRAPVIERLCFDSFGEPENIKRWIEIAVSRYLRELKISWNTNIMFPSSFYTCKSLVILKLFDFTLVDVPSLVCFPSLKTLEVEGVTYIDNSFLQTLLSSCPVLEEVSLFFDGEEGINEFSIVIPSLQILSLCLVGSWNFKGYEIDTPSLKYLKLEDLNCLSDYNVFKNMPKLREAHINIAFLDINSLIGAITSVKRLTICSRKDGYDEGFIFNELQHLTLCPCHKYPLTLLGQLLKDSPKLRVLDLSYIEHHLNDELYSRFRWNTFCWNEPSSVPECLLSSLQLFNWSPYFGRSEDKEIVVYILKNAHCLKTAIILADTEKHLVPNLKMIKELTLSSRASRTCELVFVEDYRTI